MGFGDTLSAGDITRNKLNKWLNNPPDFDDVYQSYKRLGMLKSLIRTKQRAIEDKEDMIGAESDKPRSNDTKLLKLHATKELRDELAAFESEMLELEQHVKWLEYQKTMYNAASFQSRQLYD